MCESLGSCTALSINPIHSMRRQSAKHEEANTAFETPSTGAQTMQPAVVLVPFPAQGHVTPMLQLAHALAAHGLAATVVVPDFIYRRIASSVGAPDVDGNVALVPIPSGVPDGDEPAGFDVIVHAMEHHMPAHLEHMLMQARALIGCRVACLVVDVLASWAVPVSARCGVPAVGFWPAMLASYLVVSAIPELLEKGFISESGTPISSNQSNNDELSQVHLIGDIHILPAKLELSTKELPWIVGDTATQTSRFAFWLQILQRARSFRSILVNSFPDEGAARGLGRHPTAHQNKQIFQVGPLLTNNNVDRTKGKGDAPNLPCKNPSMWQADTTCIDWLDSQREASVVYVSFGSWVRPIRPEEINELALGLAAAGRPFLWVLKKDTPWRAGLPERYVESVAGRGNVVSWAPQEDVLKHKAIGCYLTHCGWNSTLEAIHHGVRLLCYPISGDQFINCAYITKMWEIGLRLCSTKQSDVRGCIERVMGGEEGKRLQDKVNRLREKVMVGEGRCMAKKCIKTFVDEIKREHLLVKQIYSVL